VINNFDLVERMYIEIKKNKYVTLESISRIWREMSESALKDEDGYKLIIFKGEGVCKIKEYDGNKKYLVLEVRGYNVL
jgi:Cu/Ag efflux pump CusA